MEDITLTELEKTVNDFLRDLCSTWQSLLKRDGKKATGDLINSIKPVNLTWRNSILTGSIRAADYWKYVENGRRPGKFPPPQKIIKWIEKKPVKPRAINGKVPSKESLAFLIGRAIAQNGIKPGRQFHEAFETTWRQYDKKISDAITRDMDRNFGMIITKL